MEEDEIIIAPIRKLPITKGGIDPSLVKMGDVLVVRDYKAMVNVRCGWSSEMNYLTGKEFTVDNNMLRNILDNRDMITGADGQWSISLDMLEYKVKPVIEPPTPVKKTRKKKEIIPPPPPEITLLATAHDQSIIDEMISQVDMLRFEKLFKIGAGLHQVSKEILDKYLLLWANAKYEFFLVLGKKLKIESDFESEINQTEMQSLISELYNKFPQYYPSLKLFTPKSFIDNKIDYMNDSTWERMCGTNYTRGMKLSKFISWCIPDQSFNDAIAGLLNKTKVNAKVAISFDPYDYMTVSLNKNGWSSCLLPGDSFGTGILSLMLDETSLIAYKYSGEESKYSYKNYKFTGNSKSWRQLVFIDKKSAGMIFGRRYTYDMDALAKKIRETLEEKMATHLGIENLWRIKKRADGYVAKSDQISHDLYNTSTNVVQSIPKLQTKIPEYIVGYPFDCVCGCGKKIGKGPYWSCPNCQSKK